MNHSLQTGNGNREKARKGKTRKGSAIQSRKKRVGTGRESKETCTNTKTKREREKESKQRNGNVHCTHRCPPASLSLLFGFPLEPMMLTEDAPTVVGSISVVFIVVINVELAVHNDRTAPCQNQVCALRAQGWEGNHRQQLQSSARAGW